MAEDPALCAEYVFDMFAEDSTLGERNRISDAVIRCLSSQLLKEESAQVKEVIAAAIGGIGLPEAQPCLESLLKNLKKSGPTKLSKSVDEPAVRCMAVWAIGRLASPQTIKKAQ